MNLNSPQDAYYFLVSQNITGICPEASNLVACVDSLSRMCACDPPETKRVRFNQCVQNYIAFSRRASNFTNLLLTKANDSRLSFYLNGQQISTITR
jgi:hypothetical protein